MEHLGAGPSSFMSRHSFKVRKGCQRPSPVKSRKPPRDSHNLLGQTFLLLILVLDFFPCVNSEFPLLQLAVLDAHPFAVHIWEKPSSTSSITPMEKFSRGATGIFNGLYLSPSTLSRLFCSSSPSFSAASLGLSFSAYFFHSQSSSCSLLSVVW